MPINVFINNSKQFKPTEEWLIGFIETDGSLQVAYKGGGSRRSTKTKQVNPEIKFTQKTNVDVLPSVAAYLDSNGINYRYHHSPGTKQRAPDIRVQGFVAVGQLLAKLEPYHSTFKGAKYRDFSILKWLVNNRQTLTRTTGLTTGKNYNATVIGLMKSLHKLNRHEPDFNTQKSRAQYEAEFGYAKDASYAASEAILDIIDRDAVEHWNKVTKLASKLNTSTNLVDLLPPDWLAGIVAGDGSFGCYVDPRPLGFASLVHFHITMETRSVMLLLALQKAFPLANINVDSRDALGAASSYKFRITSQAELMRIIKYLEGQPLGLIRDQQRVLAIDLINLKLSNGCKSLSKMTDFLIRLYALDAKLTKGAARRYTLAEQVNHAALVLKLP